MLVRLEEKMQKLHVTRRKAKELAKAVAATFQRPVKGNVTEKLTQRLMRLGLVEPKAKELAKGLAPTVRAAIKAKKVRIVKSKAKKAGKEIDDATAEQM